MALTAAQVIRRALNKLGAISLEETTPTADLTRSLEILNDMMFGWKQKGVDVEHVALTDSSTLQLGDEWNYIVISLLTEALSGPMELSLSSENKADAMEAWNALYAAYGAPEDVSFDTTLTVMPSRFNRSGGFWS